MIAATGVSLDTVRQLRKEIDEAPREQAPAAPALWAAANNPTPPPAVILPVPGEGPLTMTSREIAELTGVRHDNAVVVVKDLVSKGTITSPEIQETSIPMPNGGSKKAKVYLLDRRSSLLLAGRLSVDFMAAVFDRWDELERAVVTSAPSHDPALAARLSAVEAAMLALTAVVKERMAGPSDVKINPGEESIVFIKSSTNGSIPQT